jgi:hypothetical protein
MLELFTGCDPMTECKEAALPLKPEVPDDMPQRIQHLLIRCWDSTPDRRPSAQEVSELQVQPVYKVF